MHKIALIKDEIREEDRAKKIREEDRAKKIRQEAYNITVK